MASINLLIIGAGFWCEKNYLRQILEFNKAEQIAVKGIVDKKDVRNLTNYSNLQRVIKTHSPKLIEFTSYEESATELNEFIQSHSIDVMIISSDPVSHQFYLEMAARNNIRVICDKPPIMKQNASFDMDQAKKIYSDFENIVSDLPVQASMSVILRRRLLEPFELIAKSLDEQHSGKGVGLNYLGLELDGGIWKLGDELIYQGAHSYTSGVGSLSHSAYHYIDLISWYITSAPGQTKYILPKLNYVYRIGDYLESEQFTQLEELLGHKSQKNDFDESVRNAELNTSFTLNLLDDSMNKTGYATFNVNHLTFTPRTIGAQVNQYDHANFEKGGRTSSLKLNVNQSYIQNAKLLKNDIVFMKNEILLDINRHPSISEKPQERLTFKDAYRVEQQRMDEVTLDILKGASNRQLETSIEHQLINMNLLSKMYELIAADYNGVDINREDLLITL